MREEYITGPDGKPVRAKHAARVSEGDTQTTFWADIRTAPRHPPIDWSPFWLPRWLPF